METDSATEFTEADKSRSTPSNRNNVGIIPYVCVSGMWSLPDETVKQYFAEMVREGTHRHVFSSGGVTSCEKFMELLREPHNIVTFFAVNNRIGAMSWINGLSGNYAFVHFSTLKWCWGRESIEFAKVMVQHWFSIPNIDGGFLLDVLIAVTSKTNPQILKFAERLGFIRVGEIPLIMNNHYRNSNDAAVIYYKVRDGRI